MRTQLDDILDYVLEVRFSNVYIARLVTEIDFDFDFASTPEQKLQSRAIVTSMPSSRSAIRYSSIS